MSEKQPTTFHILSSDSEPDPDPEPESLPFDLNLDLAPPAKLDPIFSPYYDLVDDITIDENNDDDYVDDDGQVSFVSNLFPENTNTHIDLDLGLALGTDIGGSREGGGSGGLRVVSIDSDSDTETIDFHRYNDNNNINEGEFVGFTDFDRPPYCWDYLGFNNNNNRPAEPEREIELASIVTDEGEGSDYWGSFFMGGCHGGGDEGDVELRVEGEEEREREDEEISVLFDSYREREGVEVMVESDSEVVFGMEEAIRDLEWEILLAVNNFNREVDDMDLNVDVYEAMLSEMDENVNVSDWKGCPPAAEGVIEGLPRVRLESEGVEDGSVVCAVCKEEVMGDEVVRRLPCGHYYHGECIVPWLKMRNTCPVCRRELPTDDADYELRKRQREVDREMLELSADVGVGVSMMSSPVGHDFHVFL